MKRPLSLALAALGALSIASVAGADHIEGTSCGARPNAQTTTAGRR